MIHIINHDSMKERCDSRIVERLVAEKVNRILECFIVEVPFQPQDVPKTSLASDDRSATPKNYLMAFKDLLGDA